MRFLSYLKTLLDRFAGSTLERIRLITEMNTKFRDMYCSGSVEYFCKVSTGMGESGFRHEMSAFIFRSGFKLTIENDQGIDKENMREIGKFILSNTPFIRLLMTLGFDTFSVVGKTTHQEHKYELKKFTSIYNYMITD